MKQAATEQIRIRPITKKRIDKRLAKDPKAASVADVVDAALDALEGRDQK